PDLDRRRKDLNVNHFYQDYLNPPERGDREIFDFSIGEFSGEGVRDLVELYRTFVKEELLDSRLSCYGGTSTLFPLFEALAKHYSLLFNGIDIPPVSITAFDGCHNAIYHSLCLLTSSQRG